MSEVKVIDSWSDIGISSNGRGKKKEFCPNCHESRSDKRDRSLTVNFEKGISYCHYCDISYVIKDTKKQEYKMKEYKKPIIRNTGGLSAKMIEYFESRKIPLKVLTDLKITEGMEYMPQTGHEMNTIHFNYYEGDLIVNCKWRTGNKLFKLGSDCELIPYNINSCLGKKDVIITEGEFDCMSFIAAGKKSVISVPNGASENTSYIDRFIESHFDDKEVIYIASDTDTKGVILKNALIARFGAERCKIVTYGEDCKDANEVLCKHGFMELQKCLEYAQYVPVDGIFELEDVEDELDLLYEQGLQKGATIGLLNFDALCSFETQRLCIVTGIPSSGKTEFLEEMLLRLNLSYGWKGAFFSPESLPLSFHTSRIISRITGKQFGSQTLRINEYKQAKEYVEDNFFFVNPEDWDVDTILEKFKFLVRRKGVKMVVIDPWNALTMEKGANTADTVNDALKKMQKFAQQNDVLFFLMAHPTKMQKDVTTGKYLPPTMYDISGGANFYNKADFGLTVHRNLDSGTVSVIVNKVKFRHLGEKGECLFRFNINNARYTPIETPESVVQWDNTNWLVNKEATRQSHAEIDAFKMEISNEECPF